MSSALSWLTTFVVSGVDRKRFEWSGKLGPGQTIEVEAREAAAGQRQER